MFEIYVLKPGVELPSAGTYYILARDGVYLRKDTGLVRATVKINGIAILEKMETKAESLIPKIPAGLVANTLLFFRSVYRQFYAEAVVLLHYSPERNMFWLSCPVQQVSAGSVDYDLGKRRKGFLLVGTIHSHGGGSAFHSGLDKTNEKDFDGLHITLGRLDRPYFEICSTVVVNNNRFPVEPVTAVAGLAMVDCRAEPKPTHWRHNIVRATENYLAGLADCSFGLDLEEPDLFAKPAVCYDLILPEGKDYQNVGFPSRWLERVTPVGLFPFGRKSVINH